MNKHLKFLMIAAVAVITIASCKKDKTDDTTTDGSCKMSNVKNYDDGQLESSIDLSYDVMGRIIKSSEGNDYSSTIVYTSNNITFTDNDGEKTELTLQNGRVVKFVEDDNSYSQVFTYNSDGYLVTIKAYNLNQSTTQAQSTSEITYSGGNISKVTETSIDGGTTVTNYEYSSDLAPNSLFFASPLYRLVEYYLPGAYFGKESKNLLSKKTETYTNPNDITYNSKEVSTYTFVKDAKGNYTTMTINSVDTSTSGGQTNTYTDLERYDLTYTCN